MSFPGDKMGRKVETQEREVFKLPQLFTAYLDKMTELKDPQFGYVKDTKLTPKGHAFIDFYTELKTIPSNEDARQALTRAFAKGIISEQDYYAMLITL